MIQKLLPVRITSISGAPSTLIICAKNAFATSDVCLLFSGTIIRGLVSMYITVNISVIFLRDTHGTYRIYM